MVKLATENNSLTHYTKGTQSPIFKTSHSLDCRSVIDSRCQPSKQGTDHLVSRNGLKMGSHCLYAHGFRFYFTPLSGVLFAFPSRYWFTIGQLGVFSLGGWSPHLQSKFHVLRPTYRRLSSSIVFSGTGLSPCIAKLSRMFP